MRAADQNGRCYDQNQPAGKDRESALNALVTQVASLPYLETNSRHEHPAGALVGRSEGR